MPKFTLIHGNNLSKIAVADKPPLCDGEIYYISPEQFQQKFSCSYSENLTTDSKYADQYASLLRGVPIPDPACDINHPHIISQLHERLAKPFSSVVVAKIDDVVGYGLFAKEDIPADTVIGIYNSEIQPYSPHHLNDSYLYVMEGAEDFVFTSQSSGNLTRFMQHLPRDYDKLHARYRELRKTPQGFANMFSTVNNKMSLSDAAQMLAAHSDSAMYSATEEKMVEQADRDTYQGLEAYNFNHPSVRDIVETANVQMVNTKLNGLTVPVLVTMFPIKAGRQLGFCYGTTYFNQMSSSPLLFDQRGCQLPQNLYQFKAERAISRNRTSQIENSFVLLLRELLGSKNIWGYFRKPESDNSYIVDVSVTEIFKEQHTLLLQSLFHNDRSCLLTNPVTNEVTVKNVNSKSASITGLLTLARNCGKAKWVQIAAGYIGRLDGVQEQHTFGMMTCELARGLCVILSNKINKRISLIHVHPHTDLRCIQTEFAWVCYRSESKNVSIMLASTASPQSANTETKCIDYLRKHWMQHCVTSRKRVNDNTILIDRNGEFITTKPDSRLVLSPVPFILLDSILETFNARENHCAQVHYFLGTYMKVVTTPLFEKFLQTLAGMIEKSNTGFDETKIWELSCISAKSIGLKQDFYSITTTEKERFCSVLRMLFKDNYSDNAENAEITTPAIIK